MAGNRNSEDHVVHVGRLGRKPVCVYARVVLVARRRRDRIRSSTHSAAVSFTGRSSRLAAPDDCSSSSRRCRLLRVLRHFSLRVVAAVLLESFPPRSVRRSTCWRPRSSLPDAAERWRHGALPSASGGASLVRGHRRARRRSRSRLQPRALRFRGFARSNARSQDLYMRVLSRIVFSTATPSAMNRFTALAFRNTRNQ